MRAEAAVKFVLESRGVDAEEWSDAYLWAGEVAEKGHADWKRAARQVIAVLPFGDRCPIPPRWNPDATDPP